MVIVPATTALYRLPPPSFLAAYTFFLKQGERLKIDELRAQMTLAGYQHVTQVVAPGEYCVRGGLIDLFPMGSPLPYRIDLEDDLVESIRTFDVDTQRTIYKVNEVRLLPAREFPMDDSGRNRFRARFRDAFEGDPSKSSIYKDVSNGIAPAGIEYYLPLFFEATAALFDYLPANAGLVLHGSDDHAIAHFLGDTHARHHFLGATPTADPRGRGALPELARRFYHARRAGPRSRRGATGHGMGAAAARRGGRAPRRRAAGPARSAHRAIVDAAGPRAAGGGERRPPTRTYSTSCRPRPRGAGRRFAGGLRSLGPPGAIVAAPVAKASSPCRGGPGADPLHHRDRTLRRHPEHPPRAHAGATGRVDAVIRDAADLVIGDPVVHILHGVGRYRGLVSMDLKGDGAPSEFLHLEYADDTKLYVPVSQLQLIARYTGVSAEEAPLHRLGSDQWAKAKRRAAEQVRDTAAELLELYARRAAREGHAHRYSTHDYEAFAASFGWRRPTSAPRSTP